jgi:hypothetical protein
MITTRQIERLWTTRSYERLLDDLLGNRWEGAYRRKLSGSPALMAAAVSMIRLDELNQSSTPIFGTLLRTILAAQESDGGWGDLAVTALCLRALMLDSGGGAGVARGLRYLSSLQQTEGSWPAIPIRRMSADPFTTAFIVLELGESPEFRQQIRWEDAIGWLAAAQEFGDFGDLSARLRLRCGGRKQERAMGFEPTTSALGRLHSTTELRPRRLIRQYSANFHRQSPE